MDGSKRALLYDCLAEALAEPPDWMALPGAAWPLREAAMILTESPAAVRAAEALKEIDAAPAGDRRHAYQALFSGPGRPLFWLYESQYCSGRLLGPEVPRLRALYAAAGMAPAGGELPDHAAVELAFLGFLARQADAVPREARRWRRLEKRFIQAHAGRWLPDLGRALAATGDPVYAPIGDLLAGWLDEAVRPPRKRRPPQAKRLPVLQSDVTCTLCGFCVQSCPQGALRIDENATETALLLDAAACNGCARCLPTCTPGTLHMARSTDAVPVLRVSRRLRCPACGQPTVSEAEFSFVAERIGYQAWMRFCLECRAAQREKQS